MSLVGCVHCNLSREFLVNIYRIGWRLQKVSITITEYVYNSRHIVPHKTELSVQSFFTGTSIRENQGHTQFTWEFDICSNKYLQRAMLPQAVLSQFYPNVCGNKWLLRLRPLAKLDRKAEYTSETLQSSASYLHSLYHYPRETTTKAIVT